MKLELKHLKSYPPTLQIMWENVQCNFEGIDYGYNNSIILERVNVMLEDVKPILRPMSELTRNELEGNGFDSHIDYLTYENKGVEWTLKAPYEMIVYLFDNHFDVFGLIEKGLAIDINKIRYSENGIEI